MNDAILLKAQFCAFNFGAIETWTIKPEMVAGVHLWGKGTWKMGQTCKSDRRNGRRN
jgi:hypothetical protein